MRIARGLGKETVAEFVATAELEAFVRAQGVDHVQGFHVGRPVPGRRARARHAAARAVMLDGCERDNGRPEGRPLVASVLVSDVTRRPRRDPRR